MTQLLLHTTLIVRVLWSLCYEVAFYAIVALLLFCAVRLKQTARLLDVLSLLTIGTPARLFAWIGMFSYSLYLIHLLALGIVTHGLNRLHTLDAYPLLLYFIKLLLCVAIGKLFFHFCERPFLDSHQRQVRQEKADLTLGILPSLP